MYIVGTGRYFDNEGVCVHCKIVNFELKNKGIYSVIHVGVGAETLGDCPVLTPNDEVH